MVTRASVGVVECRLRRQWLACPCRLGARLRMEACAGAEAMVSVGVVDSVEAMVSVGVVDSVVTNSCVHWTHWTPPPTAPCKLARSWLEQDDTILLYHYITISLYYWITRLLDYYFTWITRLLD